MGVLSSEDIDELRQAVSELFPDTADVYHRTGTTTGTYGGSRAAYPDAPDEAAVPVLFGARTAAEVETMAGSQAVIDQVLTFPGGVDVRQTDRVVAGGVTWEVVMVGGGGSWEVTKPVGVRRVA